MDQYTVKGFKGLLEDSLGDASSDSIDDRLVLLDRCNWYVSYIYITNLTQKQSLKSFANTNSRTLKKYLGDRVYKTIQKCLIDLKMIFENPKYSKGNFSKSYALTDKAIDLGIEKSKIYSKKFDDKLKRLKFNEFNHASENPVLKKILENTARLKVIEEETFYLDKILPEAKDDFELGLPNEDVAENKQQYYRYKAFYDEFKSLNDVSSPREVYDSKICYPPKIAKSGRIYHTVASMPRHIRRSLRTTDGDCIWEVDMSAAQPTVLILEWLKSLERKKHIPQTKGEYDLCLALIINGGLYEYISQNSTYYSGLEYSVLKKEILSALYEQNTKSKRSIELKRLFPHFLDWLYSIKMSEGYKVASHIGQSIEANIFVKVYEQLPSDRFFMIIHDSILCLEGDTQLVKDLLISRTKELFSTIITIDANLNRLFKISLVSIEDDELEKNKNPRLLKEYLSKNPDLEKDLY
jgi:hypothetical protein